tara:strand:- start:4674 stop:6686 length:2013 start_codon:yes stop_codon:yes gene_type:complete
MATHDYNLANASGASFRADLNNALQAILTNNSSASAPSTTAAYMFWADTNTGILKIRNSANDAWVELLQLDGTLTLEDGSASAVALGFRDELNTGIFSSGANNFDVSIAGTTRLNISASGINITGTVTDDGATHDGDVTFTGASANIVFDKSANSLEFADNAKAVFGNGSDLLIFHDGSNSIINEAGTGSLELRLNGNAMLSLTTTGVNITDPNGEAICQVTGFEGSDAAVQLVADEGDDNGDRWKLVSVASDNTFRLQNNVSGSNVTKWTINTDGDVTQTGHLEVLDNSSTGIISRSTATQSTDTNKALKVRNNSDTDTFSVSYKGQGHFAGRLGIGTSSPSESLDVVATGTDDGIRIIDSSTSGGAPNLEIIGKRSDSNGNTSFGANIYLGKNRTDAKVSAGIVLGSINFGGNHTNGNESNISYAASIRGQSGDSFDSKSDMPTDLIFCTGVAGADRTGESAGNSNAGTERLKIDSTGDVHVSKRIVVANNSASLPAYSFSNSNNMGFYRHSANQVGVSLSGTAEYRFTTGQFGPLQNDANDLGSSNFRFDDVFATNGTISTSDQNLKNTIATSDLGLDFINRLNPVSYKFNGKTRTHYGLIAQEIETVLGAISKPATDFAGFCKDEKDEDGVDLETPLYGLRYIEFIAPMIKALQELSAKVTALEGS